MPQFLKGAVVIEKVSIRNFQKHIYTDIEFCDGVNIISGQSDQGKSAIIRALRWCLFNRPSGFDFKSWKADKSEPTSVSIHFDDGVLERIRTSTVNGYNFNGEELRAVKTDVPDEVRNFTRIDERNLQSQHDGYYLIQDTPGEVARKLNQVVGLDIIDESLKRANSIVSNLLAEERILGEQVEDLKSRLTKYDFLDEAEILVTKVREGIGRLNALKDTSKELWELVTGIKDLEGDIEVEREWLEVESEYLGVRNLLEELKAVESEYSELDSIMEVLIDLNKEIGEIGRELVETEELERSLSKEVEAITGMESELEELRNKLSSIQKLVDDIKGLNKHVTSLQAKLSRRVKEYEEMMNDLGVCPLCGSIVENFSMERMVV